MLHNNYYNISWFYSFNYFFYNVIMCGSYMATQVIRAVPVLLFMYDS